MIIRLTEEQLLIVRQAQSEQGLEMLVHRVSNAFISHLRMSFRRNDPPLLYRLMANVENLQCQIRCLKVDVDDDEEASIDYALVDFLGVHLRPQVYEVSTWSASCEEEYAKLFAHNSLRDSVKHVDYDVSQSPKNGRGQPGKLLPVNCLDISYPHFTKQLHFKSATFSSGTGACCEASC